MNRIEAKTADAKAILEACDQRILVPRWVQLVMLPLAVLGLWAVLNAAGPVLLLFIIGAIVALLLNPFVGILRRRAHVPRGVAVLIVMLCLVTAVTAVGFLLANPVADQVQAFRNNVPEIVDDANASLGRRPGVARRQRRQPPDRRRGPDGARNARPEPHRGLGRARLVHPGRAAHARGGPAGADPDRRDQRLHAALRGADRRLDPVDRPEHAGRRLPDPDPARGVRLRPRPASLLADHGHERRPAAVGARLARDLPRRQDVRAHLRRLVRARRADPVHRAPPSAPDRRS